MMNKKINSMIFVIAATLGNLLIIALLVIPPLWIYMTFIAASANELVTTIAVLVIFLGPIIGTYPIYNFLMKKANQKFGLEKYLEPSFKSKKSGSKSA